MSHRDGSNRRDPQPLGQGWETPVLVLCGVLLGVALAALAGLGAASAVLGGGWVWPHGTAEIGHVLGGLCTGHPGRGLPAGQAHRVPGPWPIYSSIALCEALLISAAAVGGVLFARWHRPGDARGGLASRHEAEQVLGLSVLRQARTIIRPDLYPTKKGRWRR